MRKLFSGLSLVAVMTVSGCMVNPVTGVNEFTLVSEEEELTIGADNYAPLQQMEGGEYAVDPSLTEYVQSVGNRLVAVSDRQLPYEFVVLANPEVNAWALPGGKIGVNLGLFWELDDEAELAAVLGHEITHAAARHGARGQTREMLTMGALMIGGLALGGEDYADIALGAAMIGGSLINSKYDRAQELEADLYGTRYMRKAGYDPGGAVRLQETFVRLSAGEGDDFLSRMLSTHPPSEERVRKNRETAAALPAGGDVRRDEYQRRTAYARKMRPAYEKWGTAVELLAKGDTTAASARMREAIAIEPREAHFYGTLGDIAAKRGDWRGAEQQYSRAQKMNPNWYGYLLNRGVARYELERYDEAQEDLAASMTMMESVPAHYYLGMLDRDYYEDDDGAIAHFREAAGGDGELSQQAMTDLLQLDLPRNPGDYLEVDKSLDANGNLVVTVTNATTVDMRGISVGASFDGNEASASLRGVLKAGESGELVTRLRGVTEEGLDSVELEVLKARIVDN